MPDTWKTRALVGGTEFLGLLMLWVAHDAVRHSLRTSSLVVLGMGLIGALFSLACGVTYGWGRSSMVVTTSVTVVLAWRLLTGHSGGFSPSLATFGFTLVGVGVALDATRVHHLGQDHARNSLEETQ